MVAWHNIFSSCGLAFLPLPPSPTNYSFQFMPSFILSHADQLLARGQALCYFFFKKNLVIFLVSLIQCLHNWNLLFLLLDFSPFVSKIKYSPFLCYIINLSSNKLIIEFLLYQNKIELFKLRTNVDLNVMIIYLDLHWVVLLHPVAKVVRYTTFQSPSCKFLSKLWFEVSK